MRQISAVQGTRLGSVAQVARAPPPTTRTPKGCAAEGRQLGGGRPKACTVPHPPTNPNDNNNDDDDDDDNGDGDDDDDDDDEDVDDVVVVAAAEDDDHDFTIDV